MAKYRNIAVRFWSDQFVTDELTPEKRYFFLYLLTNEHTTQCGIYEITIRQIAFETGYNNETVEKLIDFFSQKEKILWSKKTNEIAIKNFVKYNPQGSPKVKIFVQKELSEVKDETLLVFMGYKSKNSENKHEIAYDTLSQEEQELEEKKEREEEQSNKVIVWPSFDDWWPIYGKKIDRPKCEKKWAKLSQADREEIMANTPGYVASTPDIQYRKHPATYLQNQSWKNEIIKSNGNTSKGFDVGAAVSHIYGNGKR